MKKIVKILFIMKLFTGVLYSEETPEDMNAEAVRLGTKGNYKTAWKKLDKALAKYDSESAKVYHNIGWIYEQKGDNDKALEYYTESLKRNPNQVHTLERAGYLLFLKKNYDLSIIYGERVLSINSENVNVLKWLADAYAERFKLRKSEIEKKLKVNKIKKIEAALKKQKEKEKPKTIEMSLDFVVRSAYEKDKSDFDYIETKAFGPDIPSNLYLNLTPNDKFQFRLNTGVPYIGTLMPDIVQWYERAEAILKKSYYYLGIGFMGNHFDGYMPSVGEKRLHDYKIGFVFGKYTERSKLDISFYPRLFPADTGITGGKTFDVDMFDVKYKYSLIPELDLNFGLFISDYYFFDHDLEIADYLGKYELSIGLVYNDNPGSPYSLGIQLTERMYLVDLQNDKPYEFGNGQGLGGINAYKWFKGDPLSGVETVSHVITVSSKQNVNENVYLYQKFITEIVNPGRERNEFALQLGVGGSY